MAFVKQGESVPDPHPFKKTLFVVCVCFVNAFCQSARKQEVLEQLEKLQDASTLRTLACRSFEVMHHSHRRYVEELIECMSCGEIFLFCL